MRRVGAAVSLRLLGATVAIGLISACGSSKNASPPSTQASVTIASSLMTSQPLTPSTTSAIAVPEGLPRFVVATVDAPPRSAAGR